MNSLITSKENISVIFMGIKNIFFSLASLAQGFPFSQVLRQSGLVCHS